MGPSGHVVPSLVVSSRWPVGTGSPLASVPDIKQQHTVTALRKHGPCPSSAVIPRMGPGGAGLRLCSFQSPSNLCIVIA